MWSAFTFLVFDAESAAATLPIDQDRATLLMCSDGPDYGEAEEGEDAALAASFEPRLKAPRVTFRDAVESLAGLENLTLTPKEVHKDKALKVIPPVFMANEDARKENGQMVYRGRVVVPAEARRKKAQALRRAEREPMQYDPDIHTVSIDVVDGVSKVVQDQSRQGQS